MQGSRMFTGRSVGGRRWRLLVAFSLMIGWLAPSQAADSEPYRMGVFPHMPPSKLLNVFAPIAEDLSNQLGREVTLSSAPTYERFMEELNSQKFDIAFVQPFDYVSAHDHHGYLPLARRGQPLTAILIVAKDSELQSIEELRGKVVANPAEVAAVSRMTSILLAGAGLAADGDVTRSYGKSHFSCMQQVLIGRADACGTARRALAHFQEKKMEARFRIIAESEPYPHALFVVHPRVPDEQRNQLKTAILSWAERPEGQRLLKRGNLVPFVGATDRDYDKIRRFNWGSWAR